MGDVAGPGPCSWHYVRAFEHGWVASLGPLMPVPVLQEHAPAHDVDCLEHRTWVGCITWASDASAGVAGAGTCS